MARDGDPLEKYCHGPGIQNYSFTMEVAEEILRRSGREWCSDLKIPSEEEYIDYNGDEDCSNSANAHVIGRSVFTFGMELELGIDFN